MRLKYKWAKETGNWKKPSGPPVKIRESVAIHPHVEGNEPRRANTVSNKPGVQKSTLQNPQNSSKRQSLAPGQFGLSPPGRQNSNASLNKRASALIMAGQSPLMTKNLQMQSPAKGEIGTNRKNSIMDPDASRLARPETMKRKLSVKPDFMPLRNTKEDFISGLEVIADKSANDLLSPLEEQQIQAQIPQHTILVMQKSQVVVPLPQVIEVPPTFDEPLLKVDDNPEFGQLLRELSAGREDVGERRDSAAHRAVRRLTGDKMTKDRPPALQATPVAESVSVSHDITSKEAGHAPRKVSDSVNKQRTSIAPHKAGSIEFEIRKAGNTEPAAAIVSPVGTRLKKADSKEFGLRKAGSRELAFAVADSKGAQLRKSGSRENMQISPKKDATLSSPAQVASPAGTSSTLAMGNKRNTMFVGNPADIYKVLTIQPSEKYKSTLESKLVAAFDNNEPEVTSSELPVMQIPATGKANVDASSKRNSKDSTKGTSKQSLAEPDPTPAAQAEQKANPSSASSTLKPAEARIPKRGPSQKYRSPLENLASVFDDEPETTASSASADRNKKDTDVNAKRAPPATSASKDMVVSPSEANHYGTRRMSKAYLYANAPQSSSSSQQKASRAVSALISKLQTDSFSDVTASQGPVIKSNVQDKIRMQESLAQKVKEENARSSHIMEANRSKVTSPSGPSLDSLGQAGQGKQAYAKTSGVLAANVTPARASLSPGQFADEIQQRVSERQKRISINAPKMTQIETEEKGINGNLLMSQLAKRVEEAKRNLAAQESIVDFNNWN